MKFSDSAGETYGTGPATAPDRPYPVDATEPCRTCGGIGMTREDVYESSVGWRSIFERCFSCFGTGRRGPYVWPLASTPTTNRRLGCDHEQCH